MTNHQKSEKISTNAASTLTVVLILLFAVLFVGSAAAAEPSFQHPGVLIGKAQLDFIKAQVAKHGDPIYAAYQKAVASPYGSLTYTLQGPPADGIIVCGSFSNPNIGCSAANSDGTAALTQALLWYITGNHAYAQNAIQILNAYARNLKGYNNSNAPLQAAWDSEKWPAAAEIIRYSDAGWPDTDIRAFQNMLKSVIQPMIQNGSPLNGNWELSMIDGMMGIAVFNDDHELYTHAVTFWQQRVPAYFYYHTDGSNPHPVPRGDPGWYGQTVFNASVDGITQETCRDFGHVEYGIAATMHAAETAHIQGQNLFESEEARLTAALEFHAFYLLGNTVPNSVCGGKIALAQRPAFELGYNEYHNRRGVSLPYTSTWIESGVRTLPTPVEPHMLVFETLTHGADAGAAATPTLKPSH